MGTLGACRHRMSTGARGRMLPFPLQEDAPVFPSSKEPSHFSRGSTILTSTVVHWWESGSLKAFSEALMKGQREPSSVSLPGGRSERILSGTGAKALKELRFQFLETWLFFLRRLEISLPRPLCVSSLIPLRYSVQHSLLSFLLTLFHFFPKNYI